MADLTLPHNSIAGFVVTDFEETDEIRAEMNSMVKMPGGAVIAVGERSRSIRPGEILARLSADVAGVGLANQYIARKSTELAAQAEAGATSIIVDDAHPFAVGDTITIGAAADEVISSVDYDTNTIGLATTLSAQVLVNARVHVNASGQNAAVGIAATRFTKRSYADNVPATTGQALGAMSYFTEGTFYLNKLHGSGDGLDTQASSELGAERMTSNYGTLVRVRFGVPQS